MPGAIVLIFESAFAGPARDGNGFLWVIIYTKGLRRH